MSDFIYSCPKCGDYFSSETSLQEHDLATHSSQDHVCLVCHKILKDLALLESHVTAHQNLLHCCNICGELCENKVDIYVHVTTAHKYGGKIICDLCSKTFSTNSSLKVHFINKHAVEMPHVLQKWELFCNIHSSRNLCKSDALTDSFYPSEDCPLHHKENESRDETYSVRLSSVSTSDRSILLSETMDDNERPRDCPGAALTELEIFLQEQSDKESWYANSTDHLSSSIRPSDILERVQHLTKNKNRLQDEQSIKCRFCDTTFNSKNDYLLAHGGKNLLNVCPHKQEEKQAPQTGLKDLIEFRKSVAGNTLPVPSKKCIKGQLSGGKTVVIHNDKIGVSENQDNRLKPKGNLLAGISAFASQIQDKNACDERNDQSEPDGSMLAETSALTIQNQNKNASSVNQSDQLGANGALFAEISALTLQIQNKNAGDENQNDQLEPNDTLLAEI